MAKYARGIYALAICDRCGLRYELLEMKEEWTHARVCPSCFETRHPQLSPPKNIEDPQAIQNARPDRTEPATGGLTHAPIPDPFVYPAR